MLCHSVRSWRSPDALSIQVSSVAIEKRQNGVPVPVYFNSGSRPRRPIRITLFIDFIRFFLVYALRTPFAASAGGQFLQLLIGIGSFHGSWKLFDDLLQGCRGSFD